MKEIPPNTYIVVPAYNEESVINEVIQDIRKAGYENIIVVDDGSSDNTSKQAIETGAITLSHKINRGKGAATKTGLEAAKLLNAEIIVTMDGDGQHNPEDISKLITPIAKSLCDVSLGTRPIKKDNMPKHKVVQNKIANALTWTLYGLWVTDSQSGFRAYSRRAADIINTRADHYNYESEVIREIREYRLPFQQIPIDVHYTDYSMGKPHRQDFTNGVKTLYKMLWSIISF